MLTGVVDRNAAMAHTKRAYAALKCYKIRNQFYGTGGAVEQAERRTALALYFENYRVSRFVKRWEEFKVNFYHLCALSTLRFND